MRAAWNAAVRSKAAPRISRHTFRKTLICSAVISLLAAGAAHAGAGWGDSTNSTGAPIKVPTFYANTPAGLRVDPINPVIDPVTLQPVPSINTGTPLRKFVDTLPPMGCATANDLGQCLPVAVPDTATYPGSDYYEIGVVQYQEKMHADLPKGTTLRGYVQLVPGTTTPMSTPHYLGPVIVATQGRPVRIKYTNLLPTGAAGDLFIPVDHTLMGAGLGPDGVNSYTENRALIHLHGGDNPWISDGTPYQWTVPVGELTTYMTGASYQNVPDMPDPGQGSGTLYWPNGLSGRFQFYHDHSAGTTRLDVYVGEAAGYLLTDPVERGLMTSGVLPTSEIPLVIEDKTFVPQDVLQEDSKWDLTHWGQPGDLWFPHVYETNQDPNSFDGTNPVGRWDWGPWFWPVFPSANPLPTGVYGDVTTTPEAFHDTPVINGTAYPALTVDPKAYRFRILNAANDRFWNLGIYVASPTVDRIDVTAGGSGYVTPQVTITPDPANTTATGAAATATIDPATGAITSVKITNPGTGYTLPPSVVITDTAGAGSGATAVGVVGTEMQMVPAVPTTGWPSYWPTDGRTGGVPDPASVGPDIIAIGNEGGLLPTPADIPSTPINYEYNRRSVTVLNVSTHGLLLGPAERADVVIDFSQFAGKTLIMYNDAPAPIPGFDPRIDYFTDDGDQTSTGGAPNTTRGYGPNTRTIMQIKVTGTPGVNGAPFNLTALQGALPGAYAATQPLPVVPETVYNTAFGTAYTDTFPHIYTGSSTSPTLNFSTTEPTNYTTIAATTTLTGPLSYTLPGTTTPITLAAAATADVPAGTWVSVDANTPVQMPVQNKAIQELFEPFYGRMNATLGVELPFTSSLTQTTIPLGYIDPATETLKDGETQIWKITHNGVDTHSVHFHLVNVQVLDRIGWDGTVKPVDPNEIGWKETVRMNPLEDIVVAARAKVPQVPFGVPHSNRLLSPSEPVGTTVGFTQVDPATGAPTTVTNTVADFDWEYVWHCHILGHEENDMMRPVVFHFPTTVPAAPNPATVDSSGHLTWTDTTPNIYVPLLGNPAMGNPASEIGYKILRSTDGVNFTQVGSALANQTSWTDPAMVGGTNNSYEVVAWNASGDSAPSNITTAWVQPLPINGLAGVSNSWSTVNLTWSAPTSPVTGYQIQRCLGTVCSNFTATGAATGFLDSGLTQNTTYAYGVTAVNGSVVGKPSTVSVTTQYAPAPAMAGLTAVGTSASAVTVSWTAPTAPVTGFTVQRCLGTTCTSFNLAATATAFLDSGLTANTTYTYNVNAVNGPNVGAISSVNVTTLIFLATPTGLGATLQPSPLGLVLNWTDNANNETGYVVQRSANGGAFAIIANLGARGGTGAMSYTDTTVVAGATYAYRVAAVNGASSSLYSNTATITVAATPAAPSSLAVTAARNNKTDTATLTWTDNSINETGFQIQYGTNSGFTGGQTTTTTVGANTTTAQLGGLTRGRTYYFRVQSFNATGASAWSNVVTIVTP